MNLIIDLGNTFAKLAIFKNNRFQQGEFSIDKLTLADLKSFLKDYPPFKNVILCSVKNDDKEIADFLSKKYFFVNLDYQTPVPVKGNVSSEWYINGSLSV